MMRNSLVCSRKKCFTKGLSFDLIG
jgi:hypothetical protein